MLLLMEGLRNHNFIIPRPRQIIKGNMDENDGNAKELLTEHPPTSCPEPAGQGVWFIVNSDRDHSAPRRLRAAMKVIARNPPAPP